MVPVLLGWRDTAPADTTLAIRRESPSPSERPTRRITLARVLAGVRPGTGAGRSEKEQWRNGFHAKRSKKEHEGARLQGRRTPRCSFLLSLAPRGNASSGRDARECGTWATRGQQKDLSVRVAPDLPPRLG